MDQAVMTPEQYAQNFAEVFAKKTHEELILPTPEKLGLVGKVCAFAAGDCSDPGVVHSASNPNGVLATSGAMFLSLNEHIRSLRLGKLEEPVTRIAHESDEIARNGMAEFRVQRTNEAGKG